MPVISRSQSKIGISLALSCGLALGACALLPACAAFGLGGPSMVAQGKYYSSGNAQYDQFFIQLYQLQVEMADAPRVPDGERQNLAQALELSPETPADGVSARIHEEAQKLAHGGVRMRLEQNPSLDKPEAASATIRATTRPKDDAAAALITHIETSATNLLRNVSQMKAAEVELGKLEVDEINLDAEVPNVFSKAHVGKQSEVKQNLADSQKLITLMKARGQEVMAESEELLAAIAKAVNTDDGALSAPPPEPVPAPTNDENKKPKPHAKPHAAAAATPTAAAAPKPKPESKPRAGGDDDTPPKPAAPSKPAPPPKDFEP
ncbi:MAG TPA: hypothetical protein VGM44_13785 [Polyangiaceae bacterium]|jgi:hypothetical protein